MVIHPVTRRSVGVVGVSCSRGSFLRNVIPQRSHVTGPGAKALLSLRPATKHSILSVMALRSRCKRQIGKFGGESSTKPDVYIIH